LGFHRSGKRKYLCLVCRKSFSRRKNISVSFLDFCEFRKLIVGKANRENLWEEKQVSRKTLSKKFKVFFDKFVLVGVLWRLLPPTLTTNQELWTLAIDGTWLHRNGVVMIYRDITHHQNIFWSYHASESYQALHDDLVVLVDLLGDNLPSGVVSDWKGAIVSGVATHFDHLPHQRCLIHVLREAKRWLPKRSPFTFTQELRNIALDLTKIETKKEVINWKARLIRWQVAYGHLLKEKTYSQTETGSTWWYTHKDLRRGWRLLTENWYSFFVHLDHPLIPQDNNSIEGINSQAKRFLGNHRGMKTPQQVSFLFWYLIFTRTKTKQDLKKLWDDWKTQKSPELDTQKVT
jgi:hypothetical protein